QNSLLQQPHCTSIYTPQAAAPGQSGSPVPGPIAFLGWTLPALTDFWSCLSCRVLSGTGLIGAGVWVFLHPYRLLQQRIPPGLRQITQMTFAVCQCIMTWGVVVIVDPVGKK
uniref:Distal membrane-arm assembly complex protein 1-like domain-containing protein n=1 Tax=Salvator merianae TaxID=96440 RepID=A0A8D0BWT7_SALMN